MILNFTSVVINNFTLHSIIFVVYTFLSEYYYIIMIFLKTIAKNRAATESEKFQSHIWYKKWVARFL